jgi:2-methylcitrate dehydratase
MADMSATDPVVSSLVRFARDVRYSDLSPATVHAIVRNLLDTVGCGAAGMTAQAPTAARGIAQTTGGSYAASAFGVPHPVQADHAIFANAAAVRNLDWHDGGINAGHPSDVTSAVIATAEATGARTERVIEAIFATYEVVGALGKDGQFNGRGLRNFIATLATVTGVGMLLELTDEQLGEAVRIAVAPNVPLGIDNLLRQSHWKSLSAAHATMTAAMAARLAKSGLAGPRMLFGKGTTLFEKMTGEFDLDNLGDPVDGKTVPERVTHKFFPCFTESQGTVALVLDLRKQAPLEDIEAISLVVTEAAWRQGAGPPTPDNRRWDPATPDVAKHSFPFLVAKALASGGISSDSFSTEQITDPTLRPLMAKVTIEKDAGFTARRKTHREENAVLDVTLKDGSHRLLRSKYPRGHPLNPMTDDELTQKFDGSVAMVLTPADHAELRDRLWNLPGEAGVARITELFRRFSREPAAIDEGQD